MSGEEPEEEKEMQREYEERAADERWGKIQNAFGKRSLCRICGKEVSEHDGKKHRFVPKIQINEEIVDRKIKSMHCYLCLHPGGRPLVKLISHPEKDLMDREYGAYVYLEDLPLDIQSILIGDRLQEFLKLIEKDLDDEGKRQAEDLLRAFSKSCEETKEKEDEDPESIVKDIESAAWDIWSSEHAVADSICAFEGFFGNRERCRICGSKAEEHGGKGHEFTPMIEVEREIEEEQEFMVCEHYICLHNNELCIRIVAHIGGEELTYHRKSAIVDGDRELIRAYLAKGGLSDFLKRIRARLERKSGILSMIAGGGGGAS